MTQYPGPNYPPQQPGYYTPYAQNPAPMRPTAVTVLAIFGIIFGALGVLCKPFGLAAMFIPQAGPNPMVDMQRDMVAWNVANTAVGLAISVLLLAGSIGSLSLKPWAVPAMRTYAVLAVLMTVVNLVVTLIWVMPKMQQAQQQMMQQQPGAPPQMAAIMQTAGWVGAVVGAVMALIYPALLWYFYGRPDVKAAFGAPGGQGGAAPGAYYGTTPAQGGYYGNPPPPAAGGYYAPPPPPPGQYPPQQQ